MADAATVGQFHRSTVRVEVVGEGMSLRLVDLLAGPSRVADLGFGLEAGTSLRSAALAVLMAENLDLPADDTRAALHTALLHHVGCTGYAHETAARIGDELAFTRRRRTPTMPTRWTWPDNRTRGWIHAKWLRTYATALHVDHIVWDGHVRSRTRADEGWRAYDPGGAYDPTTPDRRPLRPSPGLHHRQPMTTAGGRTMRTGAVGH